MTYENPEHLSINPYFAEKLLSAYEISQLITVKLLIVNADGDILVIRRSQTDPTRPLSWDLPGGHVTTGENAVDAIIRETAEEIGVSIRLPELYDVLPAATADRATTIMFKTVTDGVLDIALGDEHDQFRWISSEDFMELDLPTKYKESYDKYR